ncbi:unnamed protein product [Amoebophrya sp. A120]|nr:unnamed protein product [Amoebophrya sp. A120]|eukprot:GSA120T00000511001.1
MTSSCKNPHSLKPPTAYGIDMNVVKSFFEEKIPSKYTDFPRRNYRPQQEVKSKSGTSATAGFFSRQQAGGSSSSSATTTTSQAGASGVAGSSSKPLASPNAKNYVKAEFTPSPSPRTDDEKETANLSISKPSSAASFVFSPQSGLSPASVTRSPRTMGGALGFNQASTTGARDGSKTSSLASNPFASPAGGTTAQPRGSSVSRTASPFTPRMVTMSPEVMVLQQLQKDLSKWHLYHEMRTRGLTVNENQLPTVNELGGQNRLMDMMKKAYWDVCKEQLLAAGDDQDPASDSTSTAAKSTGFDKVVEQLEQIIHRMAKYFERSPTRKQKFLQEGVDIALVKQMIRNRAYDAEAFGQTLRQLVYMLSQLESPHQAGETRRHFFENEETKVFEVILGGNSNSFSDKSSTTAAQTAQVSESGSSSTTVGVLQAIATDRLRFATAVVDALRYVQHKLDVLQSETENFYLSMLPQEERLKLEKNQFWTMVAKYHGHAWMQDKAMIEYLAQQKINSSPTKTVITTASTTKNADEGTNSSTTTGSPTKEPTFETPAQLLDYLIDQLLAKNTPVTDDDLFLPLRVSMKQIHALQDSLQLCCLLGVVALTVVPVLSSGTSPGSGAGAATATASTTTSAGAGGTQKSFTKQELDLFFTDVRHSLMKQDLGRSGFFGDLETGLLRLVEKKEGQAFDKSVIKPKIDQIVAQLETITAKGSGAPIYQVLFARIRTALLTSTASGAVGNEGETMVKTADEGASPANRSSCADERGLRVTSAVSSAKKVTPLTVNAPAGKQPQHPGQQASSAAPSASAASSRGGVTRPAGAEVMAAAPVSGSGEVAGEPTAFFPLRPFTRDSSLGDKPWYLCFAATALREVEIGIAECVGRSWLCYEQYYKYPPKELRNLEILQQQASRTASSSPHRTA